MGEVVWAGSGGGAGVRRADLGAREGGELGAQPGGAEDVAGAVAVIATGIVLGTVLAAAR